MARHPPQRQVELVCGAAAGSEVKAGDMEQVEERRPRQGLTHRVIAELRGRIESGALKPGDKLPTEQALIRHFGVSRTVIREAVAGLRADGLVEPRQGVGVFVLQPAAPNAELPRLTLPTRRISDIIESLELDRKSTRLNSSH